MGAARPMVNIADVNVDNQKVSRFLLFLCSRLVKQSGGSDHYWCLSSLGCFRPSAGVRLGSSPHVRCEGLKSAGARGVRVRGSNT